MHRGIASSVAVALITVISATCGWSATPAYTPAQVEAAFLKATGVRLAVAPRASFPASANLSALLVVRPGTPVVKPMYRNDTEWRGELLVAVYDSSAAAETAERFEQKQFGVTPGVARNVLWMGNGAGGGIQGALVQTALYDLEYPSP